MSIIFNIMAVNDTSYFNIQSNFSKYLLTRGYMSNFVERAAKYIDELKVNRAHGEIGVPIRFKPILDVSLLTNISGELGSWLCREPLKALRSLNNLALCALQEIAGPNLASSIGPENVVTSLHVSNVPASSFNQKETRLLGLVPIRGVVAALSTINKYTRSSVICCPNKQCIGARKHRVNGRWTRYCRCCGTQETEFPAEREEGEQIFAFFLLDWDIKSNHTLAQSIQVVFKDELLCELVLGETYEVIVTLTCQRFENTSVLTACSTPHLYCSKMYPLNPMGPLATLHSKIGHTPGCLALVMASELGRSVLPSHTFMQLRLATILSLASQGSSRVVPLLVCGGEHVMASRLLSAVSCLAPRCVYHGPQVEVAAHEKKGQVTWVEAGSLLLASHGVCMLGDWAALKKDARSTVLASIESGEVTVSLQGRGLLNIPLKSAVWTHCSRMPLKLMRPLMDVFGLPWMAEVTEEDDVAICDWLLDTAVLAHAPNQAEPIIPEQYIQQFLSMVGSRSVLMSKEASLLLKRYFVASRRARASGVDASEECLPLGALQTMSGLAEAHARLSLSSTVSPADALVVIVLYEQTMTNMFGPSLATPPPLFTKFTLDNVNDQVTEYLKECAKWFKNYTAAFLGDFEPLDRFE